MHKLTIETMLKEAKTFCSDESAFANPGLFGVTDGKAVGTYVEHERNGFTFIELLILLTILCFIMTCTLSVVKVVSERYGLFFGIISGAIVFVLTTAFVIATGWASGKILAFFFPKHPYHCELGQCYLYDCYHVRLGVVKERIGNYEYNVSILYFKCRCGKEYLDPSLGFFAKINTNGNLEPYKYRRRFFFNFFVGWYDDKRIDSEVRFYAIQKDILQQLREESTDSSFVFRDKYNCLELCTPCGLVKNCE